MALRAGSAAAVLFSLSCALYGAKAAAPPEPPLVIEKADNHYDIQRDGSFVQTYHFEFRPTNDATARREAQQSVSYSPSLEKFEILEAYTRKADGRVIPVAASGFHDQLPYSSPDLASFSDRRQKVIVFPDAEGGDVLVYSWRRVVTKPAFADAFMTNIYMSLSTPWKSLDLSVTAPADMVLNTETHDMAEDVSTAADGRVTHHWHASNPVAHTVIAATSPYDRLPRVFISTFPGYDSFAAAYAALAGPKAEPSARIKALADKITDGVTDRREQARLLYDYVSLHIRYVAIYLNMGALEPHDADRVLADGYGDCKDHTVLFHALLAAKSIDADLVMINLGNAYTLSAPPTFAQLNHAISYIPEFNLYADTTAGTAPFGTLPFEEYGKPVVHAVTTGHALRRIPLLDPDAATLSLKTTARITDTGAIEGETHTSATGPFAIDLRRSALWVQANGADDAAAIQLRSLGSEGVGAFKFASPRDLSPAYAIDGSFTIDARPEILEGDSFSPPVGLRLLQRPGDLLLDPMFRAGQARADLAPCYPGKQIEDIALELPPDRKLARLPPDVSIDDPLFSYRSHSEIDGKTLVQHRELRSMVKTALCGGEERQRISEAVKAIHRDEYRRIAFAEE